MNAPAKDLRKVSPTESPDNVVPANPADQAPVDQTSVERAPRRRFGRRFAIIALPLALAIGGGYVWVTGGRYISTNDAYVQQDRVTVMPQASGQIASVNVDENQHVTAGETLFTIDDASYRTAVEAARARLASARLGVEKLKAAYAQAVASAGTAHDALSTAQSQYDRQQALLKRGVIAQATADESVLRLQRAQGAVAEAESAVVAARAALAGDPNIPTDRHPNVLEAMAALNATQLDLSHTRVEAPISGIATQTNRLQPGQYVTPATAVLAIVDAGHSYVQANYKETELTNMRAGQEVTIEVDAYPDATMTGTIDSIGAGTGSVFALLPPQNATGNWVKVVQRVPVRIRITPDQEMPPIRAGMSTEVTVDTGETRGLPDFATGALAALGLGSTAVAEPVARP